MVIGPCCVADRSLATLEQERQKGISAIVINGGGMEDSQAAEAKALKTIDTNTQINFHAPATLRKWPSLNNERVSAALGAHPYLIVDGTLDECFRAFICKPTNQRHLYEIHTTPQNELISDVLSAEHIIKLARLREFL